MQIRQQAKDIVAKMTLQEKVAQLHALWFTMGPDGSLGLKSLKGYEQTTGEQDPYQALRHGIGQITRPLGSQQIEARRGVRVLNEIQHYLTTKTRLGIPALPHEECLSGLMAQGATIFPSGINNGATWDPELVTRIGRAIGAEVYSVGSRQGLAPVLDVCRDARWGRTEETFGEDPYLTAMLACGYVTGLQDERHPVLATLKHYVGHSFSEGGRNHAPVRIGMRELNDLFLFPFEAAIKLAKAGAVMPAYHDIDGEPLHQSRELINELLRERWGFEGIVVSDYEGLDQLVNDHRTQPDQAHGAAAGLLAGVDVELPSDTLYGPGIPQAIERGLLAMEDVNEAVTRHIMQKIRLGLFTNPFVDEGGVLTNLQDHHQIAREAAEKSLVLLKNQGVLPLSPAASRESLALIGPLADDPMGMMGGYAFPVHLVTSERKDGTSVIPTLRSVLEQAFPGTLNYAKGCSILTGRPDKPAVFPGDIAADGRSQEDYLSYDTRGFEEALEAARNSDRVVIALGDLAGLFLSGTVGEGSDASTLTLPGVQQELLEQVLALGKPTIVVVFSGRPYHLGSAFQNAGAILQAWLPGQAGAQAVTDALLGRINPGGKLPVSIPRDAGAMPYYYNHKLKSAGTPIQRDFGAEYPFGYGQSYTSFSIETCTFERTSYPLDSEIRLSVTLKNTGSLPGDEVVQVYVRDLVAKLVRPAQELKAFHRVSLNPGEWGTLEITIPTDLLSYTIRDHQRLLEPGDFEFMVGTSSRDIHSRTVITLTGQQRLLPPDWRMTSTCLWRPGPGT